jgi:hypothetical protein
MAWPRRIWEKQAAGVWNCSEMFYLKETIGHWVLMDCRQNDKPVIVGLVTRAGQFLTREEWADVRIKGIFLREKLGQEAVQVPLADYQRAKRCEQ